MTEVPVCGWKDLKIVCLIFNHCLMALPLAWQRNILLKTAGYGRLPFSGFLPEIKRMKRVCVRGIQSGAALFGQPLIESPGMFLFFSSFRLLFKPLVADFFGRHGRQMIIPIFIHLQAVQLAHPLVQVFTGDDRVMILKRIVPFAAQRLRIKRDP